MRFSSAVALLPAASAISISPSATPTNATGPIALTFPGLAFEQASFYYYFGNKSHPNTFSQNLVKAIVDKTKTAPVVRVGGTSLDQSTYDPNLKEPVYLPNPNQGIPRNMKIGPSFFESFRNIPDAKYVVDIPWAKENLSNSLSFAQTAWKSVGSSNIYALEIGNEPDNYPGPDRPKGWTQKQFGEQWGKWSRAIADKLKIPVDGGMFQAVALASQTGKTNFPGGTPESWKIGDIFKAKLSDFTDRMKTVSMHYYQTKANEHTNVQADVMNHTAVVRGTGFIKDALKSLKPYKVPLFLGEVGSSMGNKTSGPMLGGVLGSALWQVDFSLYSMFLGVAGISMQSGALFEFSLWRPDYNKKPGAVLPAFYGQVFTAEFLGTHKDVSVANLDLNKSYLSAYAAYEGKTLARVAIVNLELWDGHADNKPKRPSQEIELGVPVGTEKVTVKRLASPMGGTALPSDQITWGGVEWTRKSNGKEHKVDDKGTEELTVKNKKVQVKVDASEAVMVFL
ncbi:hypothetical protein NUU61_008500 [Penicillium alfredii]|uniref:Beta-glucuronidase C-terminal domain-containing protein n=1 Tax=Penicillium alfredii TaxID=1506179 RepID=A0A9W9ELJ5_9EURO|nr:uncharacterized protein NUU61_008500 [Penicillium alfredii]KAJ5083921.1 hypothetical protein NUU61_008500 [Penicillium alfredii]